jgi:very-short-patch-repair endonuclease
MITCRVCQQEFKNTIGWKHLKKHNMTTAEYKEKYGDVVSAEYRKMRSDMSHGVNNPNFGKRHTWSDEQKSKLKDRVPPNKGMTMSDEQKEKLRLTAIERNDRWRETGEHPTAGKTLDEIHGTEKASIIKQHLRTINTGKTRSAASIKKRLATRIRNGNTASGMKGKTHTEESRKLISESALQNAKIKHEASIAKKAKMLEEIGYSLLGHNGKLLTIQCDINHVFNRTSQYVTESKFKSAMCPVCHPPAIGTESRGETELREWLSQYTTTQRHNRTILYGNKEIDIYLPEFKIAIEYDGLYWHNADFKIKSYHLDKTTQCEDQGIKLIHVFEDEWCNNKDIVKSRLLSMLQQNDVIYARKCDIVEISSKDANEFLRCNHLQGSGRANVHIGLKFENELVSVMTFLKGDISKKITTWELNRFSNKQYVNVVGGASRLFKYFAKTHTPDEVTSFADRRWSTTVSNVYTAIGFEFVHASPPNYWYFMPVELKRYHRYGLRKKQDDVLTEKEIRNQQGWLRIWDCGSLKYVWKKANPLPIL